jgi:hypothetical protein
MDLSRSYERRTGIALFYSIFTLPIILVYDHDCFSVASGIYTVMHHCLTVNAVLDSGSIRPSPR